MPLVGNVSRQTIKALNFRNKLQLERAYISMTDPGSEDPDMNVDYLLRLKFWDVEDHCTDQPPATDEQLEQIADFLLEHRGKDIVAHCEVGMCRSGAVVQAVLDLFPEYIQMHNERYPNKHVLAGIKTAVNKKLGA